MRKRIYEMVETSKDGDQLSDWYDTIMLFFITISIAPMIFKETVPLFEITDRIAALVFSADYVFRWVTADYKLGRRTVSFAKYPFTPMAVIDLLSILPFITYVNRSLRVLRVFRMIKPLRVFRMFRVVRHSGSMEILVTVMRNSKRALMEVASLAVGYVFVSAVVVFNVEPDTFESFFDAIYWAIVSLTTVGYGDIYPITTVGRTIAMISSMFGIAIVALPSGIVTAGYLNALSSREK